MQRQFRHRRGQALILVAIAILVLTAILALALDGGRIYLDRRQLQDAADAGALAGSEQLQVLPYPSYAGAHTQALTTVVKNLLGTTSSGLTAPSTAAWGPLTIGAGYTVSMNATTPTTYQVTVQHTIPTVVAPVHGFAPSIQLQVQATAQNGTFPFALILLQRSYSTTYANLTMNGAPVQLTLNGGGGVADRGGIYSNASANLGQGTVQFGTGVCPPNPPGTGNNGEFWTVTPTALPSSQVICPQSQGQARTTTQVLPDPGYPEPFAPAFTATNGATVLNGTEYLCPGHYGNKIYIQAGATGVLLPGVFHVDAGGVTVGGTLRTMNPGEQIVAGAVVDCSLNLPYTAPADTGAIIEITPANTSGQTNCSKHQFSLTGSGATVTLQPSPKYYNISLYIEPMPGWQTTCTAAPTGTNVVAIAGSSNYSIYGAIYAPADNIQIGGSGGGWGVGQIIAWTMTINGGGSGPNVTETFDPTRIPVFKGLTQ